nr:cation:proton antiporter [Janthinobacterium sp. NKUCC06_STL]
MSTTAWFILIGCLMLARGLGADGIARLPLTSAMAYLGVGLLLGPMFLGLFAFDLVRQAPLLETLTEIAVLISLFSAGVKMPVPFSLARWLPSLRLAWLSMAISVALVAAFAYWIWACPWARACCWAPSSRPPTRCWPPTCSCAMRATASNCASF